MARAVRIERAGNWYHITARGNERRAIYRDPRDRQHFCSLLAEFVATFRLGLHAFVLMDNHYHLLVETTEPNLARAMQWLNVSYSVWFNRRHGRSGHLFQGRYKAIVVDPLGWGLELSRYVHLNPVRVARLGLDKRVRRQDRVGVGSAPDPAVVRQRMGVLRRYRWSSYRAYVGLAKAPPWLQCEAVLKLGGPARGRAARERYRDYVESAVRQGMPESPWEKLTGQVVLGGAEFVQRLRRGLESQQPAQPALRRLAVRPTWAAAVAAVERLKGERWADFRDRYGDWGRDLVLYLGRKECGLKLPELAEVAGGIDSTSAGAAVKRFEQRLFKVPRLARTVAQARALLEAKPQTH